VADDASQGRRTGAGASDDERALHARLLRRDPTAPSDLANHYLEPLVAWLRQQQQFAHEDPDVLESVAIDLILKVGASPAQYDPARLGLMAYLRMAARADTLNALDSRRRRAKHLVPIEDVELRPPSRNHTWERATDPAKTVLDGLDGEKLQAMRQQFDDRDWQCVLLLADGERSTEPYAEVLGLAASSADERAREVKRVKDRLRRRLQRLWQRMYGDGDQ